MLILAENKLMLVIEEITKNQPNIIFFNDFEMINF